MTTIAIGIPKNIYVGIFKWFWTVLPGQKQHSLYIFKDQIWLPNCLLLKIVKSAHMPELKKLKMYSWKLKMVYWKLKTIYWKVKTYSWKLKIVVLFSYGKVKDKDGCGCFSFCFQYCWKVIFSRTEQYLTLWTSFCQFPTWLIHVWRNVRHHNSYTPGGVSENIIL